MNLGYVMYLEDFAMKFEIETLTLVFRMWTINILFSEKIYLV